MSIHMLGGGMSCLFRVAQIALTTHISFRLMPTLTLSGQCSIMEGSRNALLVITTNGQLFSWYEHVANSPLLLNFFRNVKKQTANFAPISVSSVCGLSP